MYFSIILRLAIVLLGTTLCQILFYRNASAAEVTTLNEGPTMSPFGCHRRMYTYRITQTDENGHECWDNVSVWSCWGRCESKEISDWKFPYKRSFHPVCVHNTRAKTVAILRNCHPEAHPHTKRYEYLEAITCACKTCSSSDTSCEAPEIVHSETAIKVLQLTGQSSDDLDSQY